MNRKWGFGGVGYIIEALNLSPIITPTLRPRISIRLSQRIRNGWENCYFPETLEGKACGSRNKLKRDKEGRRAYKFAAAALNLAGM
jgi:hypothetical protein